MTAEITVRNLLRHPSAFVPPVLSLIAVALVASHVLRFGAGRESDEGAVAHLWQLLMVVQIPFVIFFVIKWLPPAGRPR